jgi:predicted naringenin-chalcone synthase
MKEAIFGTDRLVRPYLGKHKSIAAKILSVATATPDTSYAQDQILDAVAPADSELLRKLKRNDAIARRYLSAGLAAMTAESETQGTLIERHQSEAVSLGIKALKKAIASSDTGLADIGFLCCVTSTGFLMPGLTARIANALGMSRDLQRADIVGMGCSAGVNGLNTLSHWVTGNPGRRGALVCAEINSAIYSADPSRETLVINSLFGDGVAAAIAGAESGNESPGFVVLGFRTHLLLEEQEGLRFEWDQAAGRWKFRLSNRLPWVIGESVAIPVGVLLDQFGVARSDIRAWIVHGGGPSLVEAMKKSLGLTDSDLRHTISVLREFGNISSGSYLFSLARLLEEGTMQPDDLALAIAVGPGVSVEVALLQWSG